MNHMANGPSDFYPLSIKRKRLRYRHHHSLAIGLPTAMVFLLIGMFPLPASTADDFLPYQQFVKYNNDSISLALSNVRASEAIRLMHSTTGVRINLPISTQSKTITLTVDGARMDQAIESLLTALELNNSFLVYDSTGHLTGVIALEKGITQPQGDSRPSDDNKQKTEYKNLTTPEREALVREFHLWPKLSAEDRESIHARLKTIPPSKERDELIKEYVRLVLGVSEREPETAD